MIANHSHKSACPGATLVETVISVGVLAIAMPLVFGTMIESGEIVSSSRLETRGTWIVPVCLREVEASREGRSHYFAATKAGQMFPPSGEVWALAFGDDGRLIGRVSKASHENGLRTLEGKEVRYLASLSATIPEQPDASAMLLLTISVESPAAAPAGKRDQLDFHSRIP